jgi:hypothetical protein
VNLGDFKEYNLHRLDALEKARFVEPEPEKRRSPVNLKRLKSTTRPNPRADWIEIPVPRIVDQAVWDTVQALMANSGATNPRRRKYEYLFVNKRLQCGSCGRAMSGYYEARRAKRRYRCTLNSDDTTGACGRSVDADWIEPRAWEVVEALMANNPDYLYTRSSSFLFLTLHQGEGGSCVDRSSSR